jgi:hypothetical protein
VCVCVCGSRCVWACACKSARARVLPICDSVSVCQCVRGSLRVGACTRGVCVSTFRRARPRSARTAPRRSRVACASAPAAAARASPQVTHYALCLRGMSLSFYMCVCESACVQTCGCADVRAYARTHAHVGICACQHVCLCVCPCMSLSVCGCRCACVSISVRMSVCLSVCLSVCVCAHACDRLLSWPPRSLCSCAADESLVRKHRLAG